MLVYKACRTQRIAPRAPRARGRRSRYEATPRRLGQPWWSKKVVRTPLADAGADRSNPWAPTATPLGGPMTCWRYTASARIVSRRCEPVAPSAARALQTACSTERASQKTRRKIVCGEQNCVGVAARRLSLTDRERAAVSLQCGCVSKPHRTRALWHKSLSVRARDARRAELRGGAHHKTRLPRPSKS